MSGSYVYQEITSRESSSFTDDYVDELNALKRKFERAIEEMRESIKRIEEIEHHLGIGSDEIVPKVKKTLRADEVDIKTVVDFKLVENDEDVPSGFETILMDFGDGFGDIILMSRNDLEELCRNILYQSVNSTIEVSNFTSTERTGVFNNGEWYLRKNDDLKLN